MDGSKDSSFSVKHTLPKTDTFEQTFPPRAFLAVRVLLTLFTPFVFLQFLVCAVAGEQQLIDMGIFTFGVGINVALILTLFSTTMFFKWAYRHQRTDITKYFYPVIVSCAYFVQAVWLLHMHFCGSLNSIMMGLVLVTTVMVGWFLRPRETMVFFIVGHAAMVLIVGLEYSGILDYAPLLIQRESFRSVMMDWRVVFVSSILYIVIAGTVIITMTNYRKSIEKMNERLGVFNRRLEEEVEFRVRSEKEKERLIRELQEAMGEVKTLQGLIPICSICKNIRDDEGSWNQMESYISQHSEAEFSHGLCPECAKKHYGEFVDDSK